MFDVCGHCLGSDTSPIVFLGQYYASLCQECKNKFREFEINNKEFQELKKQYEFLNWSIEIEKDRLKHCYTSAGFLKLRNSMDTLYKVNTELYYFSKNWVEK